MLIGFYLDRPLSHGNGAFCAESQVAQKGIEFIDFLCKAPSRERSMIRSRNAILEAFKLNRLSVPRRYNTSMASGLKWQFGFGWGSVSLFVALVVMSLASSGIVRWIAIVITILAFAFLVVQYKNWNTKGWRQVHGRAMHLYAPIAAKETINAKRANREFSAHSPLERASTHSSAQRPARVHQGSGHRRLMRGDARPGGGSP